MKKTFSMLDRQVHLNTIEDQEFDLVIIGGGITGAGVARDASSRGMRVALIEARDYAEGTSSKSSKLIHGGIRYLENLEFGLVFEALSERSRLFEMAPHLVHPLQFMIPIFRGSRVSKFKMALGMWLYDVLALFQAPFFHENLSSYETQKRMPSLQSDGLVGSFTYSDAYMDDDRLVIETLRSANEQGAKCLNYLKAVRGEFEEGQLRAIFCEDQLQSKTYKIKAKHFISTVGPWTDELGEDLLGSWKSIMRPSKGIHLTFSKDRVPLSSAVVMGVEERIVFGIPRHDMVIIGTTDTFYDGKLDQVYATKEDVTYLLKVVNDYFPGLNLQERDIISSYAGIRPLVDDGSSSEGETSREHMIFSDPRNVTFVSGGKYTTYRNMSEEAVNQALENFSVEDQVSFHQSQTICPINPQSTISINSDLENHLESFADKFQVPLSAVKGIFSRHGGEVVSILEYQQSEWSMEARHALKNTMCKNLVDFYFRRSPLFLAEKDHGESALEAVVHEFQNFYGWSESQKQAEINALHDKINKELSWKR